MLDVVHRRDLWPVKADIGQFEQVIINLAVNARDAMPSGGKSTTKTANVTAEESAGYQYKGLPLGEYVLVEVEDTGSGIAPEVIDKILDPFYTTKDVGKGTGLLTNRVDFAKPLNQMTAAIPLIIGIADFTWHAGNLTFTGIALGSIAALLVYHGMRLLGFRQARERSDAADPAAERR